MKVLVLLGLVAIALCDPVRYEGDKVFRMTPALNSHVSFIKNLANEMQVDFWKPDSPELVAIDAEVDIRVPASHTDIVSVMLQQSGMDFRVLIDNVQEALDQQTDTRQTRAHDYLKYNSLATIQQWITSITAANSAMIKTQVIGTSYEGRDLTLLKIGANSGTTKPAIFMDCGFHAREWISPAFCQWFVREAVTTYGTNSQMTTLLDKLDFYVLPVFNVDGYEYSWTTDRMWRKTRSRRSGNCVGVDPNRNFDAGWCTLGASSSPCSETYCGPSAESESEVKSLANFIRANKANIKAYLTVHSYSQLLLFPYSYKYDLCADNAELTRVAQGASSALQSLYNTKYTSGPGATTIYPASGGSDDWAYDEGVKYSFTFELRDTGRYGFLLPESEIKPTCEETMLAVKYIADYVLTTL